MRKYSHPTNFERHQSPNYFKLAMTVCLKEQRRKNMQAVKSSGSKIETALAKGLWKAGIRYRKNNKTIFGKPDISIKTRKIAIFVDSEFWHGKDWEKRKYAFKSNQNFWINKIENNIRRDQQVNQHLNNNGWKVLRFWGEDITKDLNNCINIVAKAINK